MKKVMIIGAGLLQQYIIERAKELGYVTVAVDGDKNAPGFKYADYYKIISIVDEEKCLEYAKQMEVDGVLTAATDYGVLTASYIAKELNIPTIAFVTTPPQFEGKIRQKNSEDNIYKLQNSVDMLFEVSVQNYVKNCHLSKTPILKIFKEIGEILQESISNIVDLINTQTSKKESIHNIFKLIQSNENGNINKSAVKIVNNK